MTLKVDYELRQRAPLLRLPELSILSKIRELERTQLTTMLIPWHLLQTARVFFKSNCLILVLHSIVLYFY